MSAAETAAFLDTSFVVRYLTDDPPEMAAVAARVIDSRKPLVLSEVVLVESAYVLESVYEVPRSDVVDALMSLVQRRNMTMSVVPKPLALEALRLCRESKRVSFADAVLWAQAVGAGAPAVLSFDERFPDEGIRVATEL